MQIFYKNYINQFLLLFFYIFCNLFFYLTYSVSNNNIIDVYTYFSILYFFSFIILLKGNSLTSILFILYVNFVLVILKYNNGGNISVYPTFQDEKYVIRFLFLLNIYFSITYTLFSNLESTKVSNFRYNNNFFYILTIFFITFIYFGISGPSLITAPYHIVSSSKNSLFEYALIFLPFLYMLIDSDSKKHIFITLVVLYTFLALLYGARIEIFGLFLFLSFFVFKLSFKSSFFVFLLLNYFAIVFSNIRTNPLLLTDFGNILDVFRLSSLSTFEDLTHSSLRLFYLYDNDLIDSSFLIENLVSSLTFLFSFNDLSLYLQKDYISGGGGLIFSHFANYFPYFHVFVFVSFLSIFFLRRSYILISLLIIFFPRLFLYYPFFFVKVLYISFFIILFMRCFFVNYKCK